MRLVFAGTPETALASLEAILESHHDVIAVLTRPDARAGRGRHTETSPVAQRAHEASIEVLQPARPSEPEFLARLAELAPDCAPVVAYGGLLPAQALAIPTHGWINLHFSVLPAWRGAAPVQRAILAGDQLTGATTFQIVEELDAGPVYGLLTEPILSTDTSGALLERLAIAGARLLLDTLNGVESGALHARAQDSVDVSYAPKVTVADAHIDWKGPALRIDRQIRACTPNPGAWTSLRGERVKLGPVRIVGQDLAPGLIAAEKHSVTVGTGKGSLELGDVRPQGRRPMSAADWARGLRIGESERFE